MPTVAREKQGHLLSLLPAPSHDKSVSSASLPTYARRAQHVQSKRAYAVPSTAQAPHMSAALHEHVSTAGTPAPHAHTHLGLCVRIGPNPGTVHLVLMTLTIIPAHTRQRIHAQMSAWSSGTWCTKKGPPEQTLSRPPAALSRRDLPYASVLASPGSTSLHPHVKPCSRVRPPSSLSHPQSSHAASRSAAACVACSCAAPATTPTPHSPVTVGPGVDALPVHFAVAVVPFVPAPTSQHKTPKDPRPRTRRKPPSVTAPTQHNHMTSHNPPLEPTPAVPSAQAREHVPPSHTSPHAELSHMHAHPSPGHTRLVRTPALPRPADTTPLPRRPCHDTHAALTCLRGPRS